MKSSIINAVIALVVCIAAIVGYVVWYVAVDTKSAAVAGLQSRIDAKKETASRTASARTALAQIAGDEAIVQGYFVSETGVVAFINDLEARGRLLGASVNVLSVSKNDSNIPTLAFALSISGTFDAVMRTVGAIEFAPYDLSLTSLAIIQDSKSLWRADTKLLVGSVSASATASTTGSLTSPQAKS